MRWIIIGLMSLSLLKSLAQSDIENLGAITERRGVILEKPTNRTDFLMFKIELLAQRWPSNHVRLTLTNDLLTLADLMAMPPGPVLMSVQAICADGSESPLALYRIVVHRDGPDRPKARPVAMSAPNSGYSGSLTNTIRLRRRYQELIDTNQIPPIPGQTDETNRPRAAFQRESKPGPLPGATNMSYSEHMAAMQSFYNRQNGGRRGDK